jgi:hypothetical protein
MKGLLRRIAGRLRAEREFSKFKDTVPVHTAPSGSQYVFPEDVLLTDEEKDQIIETVIRQQARESEAVSTP